MTSSIKTSTLTRLLDKRKLIVNEVQNSIQKLSSLSYNLSALENSYTTAPLEEDFDEDQKFNAEAIQMLVREIELDQKCLFKLKERFSKKNISIGVLGLARQGKSTLLQSLSGLNSKIIPGGSGLHCTGVKSFITNSESEVIDIEVKFYTREHFFQHRILPYFNDLGITPVPRNLAEFEVSESPEPKEGENPTAISKYKKLRDIHDNLSKFNYLLTGLSKPIAIDEIQEYVIQHDENRNPIYKYLSVEQLDIICPFPYSDLGDLTLIDMPGIGDTSIIDEGALVKELVNKVDFLLFIRKPDPLGDVWGSVDLDLYDACSQTIAELGIPAVGIKDNSFLILNHVNINPALNNYHNCQDMADGTERNGMQFSDVAIIDCMNKEEVSQKILGNIASSFVNKISQLDDGILSHSKSKLLSIFDRAIAFIAHLEKLEVPEKDLDLYTFKELFNNLWNFQTNEFENLLEQKYSLKNEANALTYNHFKETERTIKLLLNKLTETDINLSRNALGSYNKAYEDFLNEYKTHITNEFSQLDDILQKALQEIKGEVYAILKNQGRLSYVDQLRGASFDSILSDEVDNISELRNSILSFRNFQLSYLGFLHFKIREHLDILTPDYLEIRLSRSDSASDILRYVRHSVQACLYQIQKEFRKWSQDINMILFSLLEEFLNQIFRSKHAKDNWEIFYQRNRVKIWPERFGVVEEKQNQYAKFKLYIENTKKVTNEHILNIYE